DAVRPGATVDGVYDVALRVVCEGLIDLKLVPGPLDEALKADAYKAFTMHRISHWLGMDVHDVGVYYHRGQSRALEPGMVLTIEPGLYVSATADVDVRWREIGVRIEDDVLVTDTGRENLTAHIPKEIADVEGLLAAR